MVNTLGGNYIKIKQGESSGINLFDLEPDIKGNSEFLNILDKVSEIRALLSTITRNYLNRPLTVKEITSLEITISEIYREKGITTDVNSLYERNGGKLDNKKFAIGKIKKKMPTLTDLQKKLYSKEESKELAELLIPFLNKNSIGMFDCQSNIDINSELIAFDLSSIKDEFTKLYASFVIMSWIWQKFVLKNRKDKKIVAVDEGWTFVKFKESAEFLETLARRGRKHNVSLIIASQFIQEYLANDER